MYFYMCFWDIYWWIIIILSIEKGKALVRVYKRAEYPKDYYNLKDKSNLQDSLGL